MKTHLVKIADLGVLGGLMALGPKATKDCIKLSSKSTAVGVNQLLLSESAQGLLEQFQGR